MNTIEAETTNYFVTLTIQKGSVKITNLQTQRKFVDAPTTVQAPTIENVSYTSFDAVMHIEDVD